jgi:hypothetical protein
MAPLRLSIDAHPARATEAQRSIERDFDSSSPDDKRQDGDGDERTDADSACRQSQDNDAYRDNRYCDQRQQDERMARHERAMTQGAEGEAEEDVG